MAIERQIGEVLIVGVDIDPMTTDKYIVESVEDGGSNLKIQDIFGGADGKRTTRIVMQKEDKLVLNLVCMTGAAPKTSFPEGNITTGIAETTLNGLYVESCVLSKVEGAQKVKVTLTDIGVTSVT